MSHRWKILLKLMLQDPRMLDSLVHVPQEGNMHLTSTDKSHSGGKVSRSDPAILASTIKCIIDISCVHTVNVFGVLGVLPSREWSMCRPLQHSVQKQQNPKRRKGNYSFRDFVAAAGRREAISQYNSATC